MNDQPDEFPSERAERTTAVQGTDERREGFHSQMVVARTEDPGTMAGIARERFEIEALVGVALKVGRDPMVAWEIISKTCLRATYAEKAEYRYKRGETQISDVSIKGLRPIAQAWGHIRFGWGFVRTDEVGYHIRGFAHDLLTGAFRTQEHSGQWAHQRKGRDGQPTRWVKVTDERERREIVGRQGSILERNCLKAVIPFDIIEDAMSACRTTNRRVAEKDLKANPEQVARALVAAFAEINVSAAEIEAWCKCPLMKMSAEQLEELRSIWRGIRENGERAEDYFGEIARDAEPVKHAADAKTDSAPLDLTKAKPATPVDPPGGKAHGTVETKLAPPAAEKKTPPAKAGGQSSIDLDSGRRQSEG